MTGQAQRLLEECLASGDTGRWMAEHPEHRATVAPYLELERTLLASRPAGGSAQGHRQARERMLTALTEPSPGLPFGISSPLLRMASIAGALALFAIATVGAGAFFSGVNPVQEALSAINVIDDGGGADSDADGTHAQTPDEGDIDNAPSAADNGREHANDNASEGSDNSDDGIANAPDNADNGRDHADDNASEGSDNSDDGSSNGNDKDKHKDKDKDKDNGDADDNADDNASEGSDNSDDGIDNAPDNADNGSDHANDNASEGSDNSDDGSGNGNDNSADDGNEEEDGGQDTPPDQPTPPASSP